MTGLPTGWGSLSLSEIGRGGLFADGDWVESKDQDPQGSVRLTQLADVGIGEFRERSSRWLREDQAAGLGCTFLKPRDVLIARMPDPIGRSCLVPEGIGRAVTAVDVAILRVADPQIDPRYVMWAINNPTFYRSVVGLQSGTTRKRISRRNLAALKIPLPELREQRRIVDILEDHLSRLDAAAGCMKATNRRVIALRRSVLNALFSGDGHARVPLRSLVTGIEAGRSLGGSSHVAADDEWGIIKVSAMTWGAFRASENKAIGSDRADVRYEIREGDLLLSRANTSAYVGASVLVGEVRPRLLLSDKSLRLIPGPDVEREWLWRALSTPDARTQMSDAATGTKDSMRNISQNALLNVELSAVPIADQRNAVARSAEVETAIERLTAEVDAAVTRGHRLRRSLLGAAFSGQLTGRTSDMEMVKEMAGV